MLKLKENIECYSSPSQRDVLIRITYNESFFRLAPFLIFYRGRHLIFTSREERSG
jgi:hypothetical protein